MLKVEINFSLMLGFNSIIVEGADQQGKSELCKKLSSLTGWSIKHYGMPPNGFDFNDDYILGNGIIYDRNFLSEMVYSRVRGQSMRIKDPHELQYRFIANRTLLILCDRDLHYKFDGGRDEEYKKAEILNARSWYRELYVTLIMSKMKFNPNTDRICI